MPTADADTLFKLHETKTLTVLKTYTTETPLNSAAIAPGKPYVLLGGGQDAMSVTTTSLRQGKFETRFWHKIFEEEVGRVKGHFGPVNTYVVRPALPPDATLIATLQHRCLAEGRLLCVWRRGRFRARSSF